MSESYTVYDFGFSGHGDNKSQADFSMDLFADDLIDFITKNKIDSPNVFGYSMGGYVALTATLKHSGLIQKIVTLGTYLSLIGRQNLLKVKLKC